MKHPLSNAPTNRTCFGILVALFTGLVTSLLGQEIVMEQPMGSARESTQVVAWGRNQFGQTTLPQGLAGVIGISAAGSYTVALRADGTVVAWGDNFAGQRLVPAGLNGVQAIAAGWRHVVALKGDGSVVAWGNNSDGQTNVPLGLNNVRAIAAGSVQSVALKQDGSLVAWGFESNQLTGVNGVQKIAAQSSETHIFKQDGSLWAWTLGTGGRELDLYAVQAIAYGYGPVHRLVLKADGTVFASGDNSMGQANVPAGLSSVRQIAAGQLYSLALQQDGTVVTWGDNAFGLFSIPAGLRGVQAIATGVEHSVALKASTVDFGSQALGNAGSPKAFSIKNTGVAALHIASVTVVGANAADFSVNTASMAAEVPANVGATSFTVTFAPTGSTTGPRQAWLRVANDDADEANYVIQLTGSVPTDADIAIFSGASTAPADERQSNAAPFAFPDTKIRTASSGVITLKNVGLADSLRGLQWEIVGPAAAEFTVNSYGSASLAPSQTTSLTIEFRPNAAGSHQAQLRIYSNDPDESPFTLNLTGRDITPDISVRRAGGPVLEFGQVVAWGKNDFGQATVPAGLSGVLAIAAGGDHSLALQSGESVVAWGYGSNESLVPEGLTGMHTIAAGRDEAMALQQNGVLVTWGLNGYYERPDSMRVPDVLAIATQNAHLVALMQEGTVLAWGNNNYGKATVPLGLSTVKAIAAGGDHTVALKQDGTWVAWGLNTSGQTTIPVGLTGVKSLAAGADHTVALLQDGTVVAWGSNSDGQTTIPPGLSDVKAIVAGDFYTLALKQNGTVVAWGSNSHGQTTIPPGLSGVHAIAAGDCHTVALKASTVEFGSQNRGTTGPPQTFEINNTGTASLLISSVTLEGPNAADFLVNSTGMATTVAPTSGTTSFTVRFAPTSTTTSQRQAWLRIKNDDLDEGSYVIALQGTVPNDADLAVFSGESTAVADELPNNGAAIAFPGTLLGGGSSERTFTLKNAGDSVSLSGLMFEITGPAAAEFTLSQQGAENLAPSQNTAFEVSFRPVIAGTRTAQLSIYSNDPDESPYIINLTGVDVSPEISLHKPPSTVLEATKVVAWGYESYGQTTIPSDLFGVAAIAAGGNHSVALTHNGTVVAWGNNSSNQATVPPGLSGVVGIDAGDSHTMALKQDGSVVAWGNNSYGQTTIPAGLSGVRAIAAGGTHTVALKLDGTVVAWGNNNRGQRTVPAGLAGVKEIAAGTDHTVALKSDGTVVAWGYNNRGQTTIPVGLTRVQSIAAGYSHTVALKTDGTVVAWGNNSDGQTTIPAGLAEVRAIAAGDYFTVALKRDGTVVTWGSRTIVPAGLTGVQAISAGGNHVVALTSGIGDVGFQMVGNTGSPSTLLIKNTGTAELNISSVSIVGGNAADFILNTTGLSPTLPAFTGSTSFSVTFAPVGPIAGRRQAWLLVSSDDMDESSYLISLVGTVLTDADIAVFTGPTTDAAQERQNNGPVFSFPNTTARSIATTQRFTLQNKGPLSALTDLRWDVIGPEAAEFTVDRYTNPDLAANAAASFTVSFLPGAIGVRTAQLRIFSNDLDETPFLINLQGLGVTPEIGVEYPLGSALATSQVLAWGSNPYGQTSVPAGLSDVQAIAVGDYHTVALKLDGTVVAWGDDGYGQRTLPVGLASVKAIAAGARHTVALKQNGTVVAWGDNNFRQTTVPVGLTGVKAIAAGDEVTVALKQDGTVVAWGSNIYSQTSIPLGLSSVQAIAAGANQVVALKSNGTVQSWGINSPIPLGFSGVQAIAAGGYHTRILKLDGTVVEWLPNSQTAMPPGLASVQAISVSATQTMALKQDGSVVTWGHDLRYDGPIPPPGLSGVQAIVAGNFHAAAIKASTVSFGNQAVSSPSTPRSIAVKNTGNGALRITSVSVVGGHAADFSVNTSAMASTVPVEVGTTAFTVTFSPTAAGLRQAWLRIVSDDLDESSFVIALTGWGVSEGAFAVFTGTSTAAADERQTNAPALVFPDGALRFGTPPTQTFTVKNVAPTRPLNNLKWDIVGPAAADFSLDRYATSSLAANTTTSMTVSFRPQRLGMREAQLRIFSELDGSPFIINLAGLGVSPEITIEQPQGTEMAYSQVVGWGLNTSGQTIVPAELTDVQALAAGSTHTVALKLDGTVIAWGGNAYGQRIIPAGLASVRAVSVGNFHTVALKQDGSVAAWGLNTSGQTTVPVGLSGVKSIAAGGLFTAALKQDGTVVVWGSNTDGQGTIPAGLSGVQAISAGYSHVVALKLDGTVVAWGSNNYGETIVPSGLSAVRAVAAGKYYTVALKGDGTVVAWGSNDYGQITIPAGLANVQAVAAGDNHAIALKHDGTLVAWGRNTAGQATIPAGLNGVLAVAGGAQHSLALKGHKLNLGDVRISQMSQPITFTVKNSGSAPLSISSVSVVGANPEDFTVTTTGMQSLVPALTGQTSFTVSFRPSAEGNRSAFLRLANDDLDEGEFGLFLTGTGLPNQAPVAVGALPAQTVRIGSPLSLDLSSYFYDPEAAALTYSVVTNTLPANVTASVSGATLLLTGVTVGTTSLTLRATDAGNLSTNMTFPVSAVTEYPPVTSLLVMSISPPSKLPEGSLLLPLTLLPGRQYLREFSNDLIAWIPVPGTLRVGSESAQWIDRSPASGGVKKFYRLREITTP